MTWKTEESRDGLLRTEPLLRCPGKILPLCIHTEHS